MILNPNSAHYREDLYKACIDPATGFAHCNICNGRVLPGEAWEESHIGAPAALGGDVVGIAHVRCNREHGLRFVIPMVAKAKRMWRKHHGIAGPGITETPLPAGRNSNITKKLNGKVEPRLPRYDKHHRAMAEFPNRRPE